MNLSRGFLGTTWATLAITGAFFAGCAQSQAATIGDKIVGNNTAAASWYHQTTDDCVEASVNYIYGAEHHGNRMREATIDTEAVKLGVLNADTTKGSNWYALPILAAHYGMAFEQGPHTVATLEKYLAAGDHVIAVVNGELIWHTVNPTYAVTTLDADHALVVDSIDITRATITLTDGGIPEGRAETIPLAVFRAAWSFGGYNLAVAK